MRLICDKKDDSCPAECVQGEPHKCFRAEGCTCTSLCKLKGTVTYCVPYPEVTNVNVPTP